MSRFNPNHHVAPIYDAAAAWKTYRLKNDYLPQYQDEAGDRFEFVTFHQSGDESVAILDAKWKRLNLGDPNSGVSSGDAYQMNAYSSCYRCKRLTLVYPASEDCPPRKIIEFALMTEERPILEVIAFDVRELAFGSGVLAGTEGIIPIERHWKQRSSQPPIYEALCRTSPPFASTVLPRVLETQTPPRRAARKRLITRRTLVAGVGFEPTTFRL